uniref:Uncharacterized protein n=1 Tax=viral metagenome TaxID=1070528 RepID=A0A6C0BNZ2_9ZZZZ
MSCRPAPFAPITYENPNVTFTRLNPETACPPPRWVQHMQLPPIRYTGPGQLGGLRPLDSYSPQYLKSQMLRAQNSYR